MLQAATRLTKMQRNDDILRLIERGWSVVPVPFRSKKPILPAWQTLEITTQNLSEYFNGKPQNVGIVLGQRSNGLIDVDLDSPEAIQLADWFLPSTEAVFGRQTKPRSHRLYISVDAEYRKFISPLTAFSTSRNTCICEIRTGSLGKGIQTIFPPSVHESGEEIRWVKDAAPSPISGKKITEAVGRLAAACLLVGFWQPGSRHDLTLAVAGALLRNGIAIDDTKHFVKAVCFAAGDKDVKDRLAAIDGSSAALDRNAKVYGLPKLAELTDQKLVNAFCEWLQLRPQVTTTKKDRPERNRMNVVCMADVEAKEIDWLWKPFIPTGEFTILEGIEGLGKSWLSCALACAVASGSPLPFHSTDPCPPSRVLLLSAEDSLSHTVRPRLDSMKADLSMIFAIEDVFSLNDELDLLSFEATIAEHHPKLVIIDPMFSYTSGKDLNAESSSRPIARKLIALAQKYNCAIVGIRHVGKSKGGGDPRNAGLGSISWRASARSVLLVGEDPDSGERAICQTKNNLSEQATISVGYEIVGGQFLFKGTPSSLTKERMLAQVTDPSAKSEQLEVTEILREMLTGGERLAKDIENEFRELGVTGYAIRKARTTLKVEKFKKGGTFGGDLRWYLKLPGPAEVVDIRDFRHVQLNEESKANCSSHLAEDFEPPLNGHLQSVIDDKADRVGKIKTTCICGEVGYLGRDCRNCGETVCPADESPIPLDTSVSPSEK